MNMTSVQPVHNNDEMLGADRQVFNRKSLLHNIVSTD